MRFWMGTLRTPVVYAIEIASIAAAAVLAFLLRFDFHLPTLYAQTLLIALAVWIPLKLATFKMLGLDRRWARYVSLSDLTLLILSNIIGSGTSLILLILINSGVPRSVYAIDWLLCVCITAGTRISVRLMMESLSVRHAVPDQKRTVVYGAGNAGLALLRDIRQNPSLKYDVAGFIDDNSQKQGLVVHGVRVLGYGEELPEIARKYGIQLVLIAIPSASGSQMKAVLERCTAAGVPYKTIPSLAEIMDDGGLAKQIRDVAVEDLLGRTPVDLDQEGIQATLRNRVVLVTGAAGSIGSEICRQVARFRPAALVCFEIAESPLFNLERELNRQFPEVTVHAEIGNIQKPERLREVFDCYRPSVVYHAAAYKHVPLMESHIFEAIENNVFGTLNVVEAARAHGVSEFVMISSDKAVRPANIMGATKRIAELLVRSLQPPDARYVSVRFGNVLGSNGSVVPIFKEQIALGGPVTVTHPEMRRYFMTIPEACQLVLQASSMGRGGEIFVLEMGEPVKIVDLARNLILLSGLRPDVDVRIEFTGERPGEKLFEELSNEEEGLIPTAHEKIRAFAGASKQPREIEEYLAQLRRGCHLREANRCVTLLRQILPEYNTAARDSVVAVNTR